MYTRVAVHRGNKQGRQNHNHFQRVKLTVILIMMRAHTSAAGGESDAGEVGGQSYTWMTEHGHRASASAHHVGVQKELNF